MAGARLTLSSAPNEAEQVYEALNRPVYNGMIVAPYRFMNTTIVCSGRVRMQPKFYYLSIEIRGRAVDYDDLIRATADAMMEIQTSQQRISRR
jgi:hypothetical protein